MNFLKFVLSILLLTASYLAQAATLDCYGFYITNKSSFILNAKDGNQNGWLTDAHWYDPYNKTRANMPMSLLPKQTVKLQVCRNNPTVVTYFAKVKFVTKLDNRDVGCFFMTGCDSEMNGTCIGQLTRYGDNSKVYQPVCTLIEDLSGVFNMTIDVKYRGE